MTLTQGWDAALASPYRPFITAPGHVGSPWRHKYPPGYF